MDKIGSPTVNYSVLKMCQVVDALLKIILQQSLPQGLIITCCHWALELVVIVEADELIVGGKGTLLAFSYEFAITNARILGFLTDRGLANSLQSAWKLVR